MLVPATLILDSVWLYLETAILEGVIHEVDHVVDFRDRAVVTADHQLTRRNQKLEKGLDIEDGPVQFQVVPLVLGPARAPLQESQEIDEGFGRR